MTNDLTMNDACRFGSTRWVAMRLGMTRSSFYKKRPALEASGFPKPDPITGLRVKDDVDAWINARQKTHVKVVESDREEPDYDAI